MRIGISILAAIVTLFPATRAAAGDRSGEWTMTQLSFHVAVESWGEDCGPEPKSFERNAPVPVTVTESGGHLIFSKGDIRTDRCGSPNPKVRSVLSKRSDTRWKRICRTAKDDPKFEEGEYVLETVGEHRMEYTAVSSFDWKLKADHCRARSTEKRIFIRNGGAGRATESAVPPEEEPESSQEPTSESKSELKEPAADEPEPLCATPGEATALDINPKRIIIGPGERVCMNAVLRDAHGCKTGRAAPRWSTSQDDRPVSGLMTPGGCFQAGETAADAEGTYTVTARQGSHTAVAEVTVAFVELGDLLAARLRPLEDIEEAVAPQKAPEQKPSTPKAAPPPAAQPTAPTAAPAAAPPSDETTWWIVILAALAGMAVAVLLAFVVVRLRKAAIPTIDDDPEEDGVYAEEEPDRRATPKQTETPPAASRPPAATPGAPRAETARLEGKICPTCGRTFGAFAKFCPHDKSALETVRSEMKEMVSGMVCPKCFRGYDQEARFCPHDAVALIPYSEWRRSKMPPGL